MSIVQILKMWEGVGRGLLTASKTSSRPHRCHVQWLYIIPIFCFSTLFYTCIYIHCYFLRINFVTFCKMFCLFFNHFCAYNSRKKLLNIIPYEIYFKNQLLSLVSSCGYAGIKHGRKNIIGPWVFPAMIARFIAHM